MGFPFWPVRIDVNGASCSFAGPGPTGLRPAQRMFTLAKLKNKAIVSDVVSSEDRPKQSHRKGINVLYANGGAHWVDIEVIHKQLYPPPGTPGTTSQFDSQGRGNW